jgi:hypothetical protein
MAGAAPSRGCDDVRKNRFLTRSAVCGALKAYRKKYLPAVFRCYYEWCVPDSLSGAAGCFKRIKKLHSQIKINKVWSVSRQLEGGNWQEPEVASPVRSILRESAYARWV